MVTNDILLAYGLQEKDGVYKKIQYSATLETMKRLQKAFKEKEEK